MFKLSESDLDKIVKGLGYLMDNNSPLYLKKGFHQNFLRNETAEVDEFGSPVMNFSGVEFTLESEITEDIFITNGLSLINKIRYLKNPTLSLIEGDDGSIDLEIKDGDYFTFNVGLSDSSTIFMEYGGNEEFINVHKKYLKDGLVKTLEKSNVNVLELFISYDDIDKIKKFNNPNNDNVHFIVSNNKVIVSNNCKSTGHGYKFILQENIIEDDILSWNIPTNRLNKIHKSDYKMFVYHKDSDVKSVTLKSVDNGLIYILPLIAD